VTHLVEINLPFSWELKQTDTEPVQSSYNTLAYSLLAQEFDSHVISEHTGHDNFARVEQKLDLILVLLAGLLNKNQSIPKTKLLRLGADTISWMNPEAEVQQTYCVSLYLSESHAAFPLRLVVTITHCEAGWCEASIEAQTPEQQSCWEKWVFRQHRRLIQDKRSQHTSVQEKSR
jgi:hypothetical protein